MSNGQNIFKTHLDKMRLISSFGGMKLGIIGCGKMGAALIQGILAGRDDVSVMIKGGNQEKVARILSAYGSRVSTVTSVSALVAECDTVIIGVKPADVSQVLSECTEWSNTLLLSVAAGVKCSSLSAATLEQARIVRVMPNTPALIGAGASAYCLGPLATEADAQTAEVLLSSVGTVSRVKESLMDAVTGVSGSGPAYVYMMIEALSDAGVKQGLPRETALELAVQTLKGAALMVEQTGEHPAVLKEQVTSPGGTTITGVATLESYGLRNALIEAVEAATEKSKELGA